MSSSSGPLTEELQCSICLDAFTDPVTAPCGHNFCKTCLNKYWDNSQTCNCPYCKETFNQRPDLKINTTLREVADHYKKKSPEETNEVLCDFCEERKLKAFKSCLVCQSSYCETHLEPHLKVAGLKKHKLMNPVSNLEDYICQKHERPLELFCRDDRTCVCPMCALTDHKNHNTVPLEKESEEQKVRHKAHNRSKVSRQKFVAVDGKQKSYIKQKLPYSPKRFTYCPNVLAEEGFSSGKFYFEVQVKGKTEWELGVARESIKRKGKITLSPEDGFWTVWLRNKNQYAALSYPTVPLSLRVKPQRIGVFVDYEKGLVSFYDVESSSHIYSFTGQSFTGKLYPYFGPSLSFNGRNSAPLIITPVNSNQ
uniref:Uncharacterized protein n=1 Tax=Sinocyclocheilus rhinocerous TaxID=307959 RepID=A0A673G5M5_9TELE